jgi:hypothetical protein
MEGNVTAGATSAPQATADVGGEQMTQTTQPQNESIIGQEEIQTEEQQVSIDDFINNDLKAKYELSDSDISRIKEAQEKYGLTNDVISKIVEMEADKKANELSPQEKVKEEYNKLTKEERAEAKQIANFFKERMGETEYNQWLSTFNTVESFRTAKALMNSLGSGTPTLDGNTNPNATKSFNMGDYTEAVNKIREASKKMEYEKVDQLKKELYNKIERYGDDTVKKLLVNRR